MVGRLPTKCQNRRSLGVEGYPRPPARAETRALTSRAAAASAASTPMGDQTAALTAALTEAIVAALQPLLQRTPWGDPLIAEDSDQGGWIRDGAQYYGEEYFWLPPGQTPRQWREVHRQMREQQQLHAKEVQPQPEPDEGAAAATAAAAVLAAATLAAKAELAIQRAVEDEEAIVHIARAGAQPGRAAATAEWPELPATCVPPPTTPSRGEPGRRAQGRARARARRAVASLAAASTAAATAAAVAAAAAIVVSVSDTTPEAASAADAAVDHEESTAAAHSGLGLIEQGAMVCLQRTDPLGLWGPVGAWADEPCPLYVKLEVQAASPSAQDATCDFLGSPQAANGAVCGATGAPGAGGDASPNAQDAICTFSGSLQAANGAVCGATGAPGAGGDASPSAQDAICTFSGSLQAANGAVCGATGAPGAGGDASPSAQDATCDFSGSLQAANGAVCGATKAPGAGGEASPGAQDAICAFSGSLQAANGAVCGATGAPGAGGDASPSAQAPPPCLALTQCPGASGGCIVFEEVFQGGGRQQEMLEDEVCTRACIEELQVATLELLMGSFREGGLRLSAPPSPINLSPNPPPGRLPCAAPWGSDSVSSGGGWGLTPPLHCPRPSLLPPRPRGQGRGGVAALPPSLRGPLAQPTSGGNGGALPVARAAGLPVSGGAQLAFVSASPVMSRAREPPPCDPSPRSGHKVRTWGEGDHNRPLPQVHPAAPALELGQSVSATASPEEVHVGTSASTAAGPAKEAWGVGIPDRPLPPSWPQAAARAVLGHSPGGGHAPPAGGKEAPAPAHQGGSRVPVMVHGRASSEVT